MASLCASVFALFVLYVVCCGQPAVLEESFKLSADESCAAEGFTLIHRLNDDSPLTVAKLQNGVWVAGDKYRGRVEHSSGLSLWLNRLNYNDNGVYEFTCAGQLVTIIQLQVLIISNNNISVTEGAPLTLPCYFLTVGQPVQSVVWERHGERVLWQSLSTGEVRHGAGFEGRVSVSSDYRRGNLSLILERVQPEDRGDFFCSVYQDSLRRERGNPAVVRVAVNKRSRGQITSSTSVSPTRGVETEKEGSCGADRIITASVVLLTAALCAAAVCFVRLRVCRSGSSCEHGGGKPSDVERTSDISPASVHANGAGRLLDRSVVLQL